MAAAAVATAVVTIVTTHQADATAAAVEPGTSITDAVSVEATPDEADTWAVIIGINDYPGSSDDLAVAVNDAHDIDTALAHAAVPSSNRVLLTDDEATASNITEAIEWLISHAGPDDQAILAYAGHVDYLTNDIQAIRTVDNDQLTDTRLARALEPLAVPTWVIIAGCYSAGFDELLTPNRALTAAAPADQLAYENLDIGNSYLIDALAPNITGDTLHDPATIAATAIDQANSDYPSRRPIHTPG